MQNQSKKLQELKESSDAVFQELFGKSRGEEALAAAKAEAGLGQAIPLGGGRYAIGDKIVITKLRGVSEHAFINYDFASGPLAWILDCAFQGEITIKITGRPELTAFQGKWYDGVFKGKYFGVASEFYGGQFGAEDSKPVFLPPYDAWKTSPHFFYDGVIKNHEGGILGRKNLPIGEIQNSFNALSLRPGHGMKIRLSDGREHEVICIKRMGGNNRMFEYSVKSAESEKPYRVIQDWLEIRGNSKVEFLKNTNVNLETASKTIDLFKLDISPGIASVLVSVAGTSGPIEMPGEESPVDTPTDFAGTQQVYDLGQIPVLALKAQERGAGGRMMPIPEAAKGPAYFYIPDEDYMIKFEEVKANLENGGFQRDISIIRSAMRNGLVTGYDKNYPYLIKVFPEEGQTKMAPKEVKMALGRMDDFMRFFVDRMYMKDNNAVEDDAKQEYVTNKLKSSLGVQAAPEDAGAVEKPKKVRKIKAPRAKNEALRETIRDILLKNM